MNKKINQKNMTEEQSRKVKAENDLILKGKGYRVNDWLPIIERPSMRSLDEIKGRMSVMNALINISFDAPIFIIKEWIGKSNFDHYLSKWETAILEKDSDDLTVIESNGLRWYLEGLWALMWVTGMIDELDEKNWCGDHMASLLPNLEEGETNEKLDSINTLLPEESLFKMLDYYYRLHWYCVDERLQGRKALVDEGLVYERRKALEWAMNQELDWDDVEMGT
jgi:hypothetical protein